MDPDRTQGLSTFNMGWCYFIQFRSIKCIWYSSLSLMADTLLILFTLCFFCLNQYKPILLNWQNLTSPDLLWSTTDILHLRLLLYGPLCKLCGNKGTAEGDTSGGMTKCSGFWPTSWSGRCSENGKPTGTPKPAIQLVTAAERLSAPRKTKKKILKNGILQMAQGREMRVETYEVLPFKTHLNNRK